VQEAAGEHAAEPAHRHVLEPRLRSARAEYDDLSGADALPPAVTAEVAKTRAIALLVLLMFVGVLFTELSQEALSAGGWDVEWLATLPIEMGELFTARLVARTLMSPLSLFWLVPLLVLLSWENGPWWATPLLALAVVLPLLLLRAALSVLLDATLHLRVSTARLRNLKGVCAIVGTATLFLGFCARHVIADAALGWGSGGSVLEWLPTGLVVRALADAAAQVADGSRWPRGPARSPSRSRSRCWSSRGCDASRATASSPTAGARARARRRRRGRRSAPRSCRRSCGASSSSSRATSTTCRRRCSSR
jgi:hypothetical protein